MGRKCAFFGAVRANYEIEMSVTRRRVSSKSEDTTEIDKLLPAAGSSKSYTNLWRDEEDKENNMGRDRTSEFQSALRSLQGRAQMRQPNALNITNNKVNRNLDQYSEFMRIAKYVCW